MRLTKIVLEPPPEARPNLEPPVLLREEMFPPASPNLRKRLVIILAAAAMISAIAWVGNIQPSTPENLELVGQKSNLNLPQAAQNITADCGKYACERPAGVRERGLSTNTGRQAGAANETKRQQREGNANVGHESTELATVVPQHPRMSVSPSQGSGATGTPAPNSPKRSQIATAGGRIDQQSEIAKLTPNMSVAIASPPTTSNLQRQVEAPKLRENQAPNMAPDVVKPSGEASDRMFALSNARSATEILPVRPSLADTTLTPSMTGLERLRTEATMQERDALWSLALRSYEKALVIDPTATFAQHGKRRVEDLAKLQEAIDFYLTNPVRLQSPDPMKHAKDLIVAADQVPNIGPRLRESQQKLRALIDRLGVAVAVTLRSDAETQVSIYRVGDIGRFTEQRIQLSPGEYVAVGTRDGFRDVRIQFRVVPDMRDAVVNIHCEERI